MTEKNRLFYGDNLDVLREHVGAGSVDLVYLDPPFNSNRSYNVIFGQYRDEHTDDTAQIQAFDDTWHWTPVTEEQYRAYVSGELPNRVAARRCLRSLSFVVEGPHSMQTYGFNDPSLDVRLNVTLAVKHNMTEARKAH